MQDMTSVELDYRNARSEDPLCSLGFSEKSSLWMAQTSDRLHTLKRQYAIIKALGINCEILNVDKFRETMPIIDPSDIWVSERC